MGAVDPKLISLLKELQALPSLSEFVLAGGTNLALRYNHRKSIDIDLISNEVIGKIGFEKIIEEITSKYGDHATLIPMNEDLSEQFIFLRAFIPTDDLIIKVEILQNIQYLFDVETQDSIRLLSSKDVGLLKLMSASNRFAKKDIYDLDYITDDIDIVELFDNFKQKSEIYNKPKYKCLFDLDDEESPIDNLDLLLAFDRNRKEPGKVFHSHDRIDVVEGSKSWALARINWRSKLRKLYKSENKNFPNLASFIT
ncbi:nucleotidyl transferase AbiEii/AbiGii toxin family protein [Leeuwenhoekiella sp. A16]|uniref:nucleotidyl transferase AbiEii/AbiGii toxin family protein n=1 Tax=unclassified Leeuwenhoekiella TaxID=2615029 RepID=UPI003A7F6DC8